MPPSVPAWLAPPRPDVVCLQETKQTDDAFPALDFHAQGYASVHHGEGRWNGVAIAARCGVSRLRKRHIHVADGLCPGHFLLASANST